MVDPRTIDVYNLRSLGSADLTHAVSNDPPIQLLKSDTGEPPVRTTHQQEKIARAANSGAHEMLDWPYRKYSMIFLDADTRREVTSQFDNVPPQPVIVPEGPEHQPDASATPTTPVTANSAPAIPLILFNVLVALEWVPNEADLRQLKWAFRRASDFLYDVTDGLMAFQQVVFLDEKFLDCADIQIMASNQYHPRSWVSGLHTDEKYRPIRLGRGLWHEREGRAIPWDEPEAYRPLVHEWAHYALNQKDEYLELRNVTLARTELLKTVHGKILISSSTDSDYRVVIQRVNELRPSIMATLEGTSELVPGSRAHRQQEWKKINDQFKIDVPERSFSGPGRLPLPLPAYVDAIGGPKRHLDFPHKKTSHREDDPIYKDIPEHVPYNRLRVYTMRGLDSGTPRLIAQGSLEARTQYDGFPLLGADAGDTVVLSVDTSYGSPDSGRSLTVLTGEISPDDALTEWNNTQAAPGRIPMIDVWPEDLPDPHSSPIPQDYVAPVRVRIRNADPPKKVWLFPLSQPDSPLELQRDDQDSITYGGWVSTSTPLETLDGHVLLSWTDRHQLMICPFSQGGGPPSHDFAPIPISAGSSDGDVQIFFHDGVNLMPEETRTLSEEEQTKRNAYALVKVITTVETGADGVAPKPGAYPWSYAFGIASNQQIPPEFAPTLIVHYAVPNDTALLTGDILVCRLQGTDWVPQPTYNAAGGWYAAMPMATGSGDFPGGTLVTDTPGDDGLRVEHFRLYWIPRGSATA